MEGGGGERGRGRVGEGVRVSFQRNSILLGYKRSAGNRLFWQFNLNLPYITFILTPFEYV